MQPISRKAILFGAPGGQANGTNRLTGVEPDLQNVKRFLLSPNGGAWRENEIIICNNVTSSDVRRLLQNNPADFCFIYFSGHGGCDYSGARYLCLQDGELAADQLFNSTSIWQLGIADSCGNYFAASIGALDVEQWFGFDGISQARQKFDEAILSSTPGLQTVFPSQAGESTRDSNDGGNFTLALLRSAKKKRSTGYSALTIQSILLDIPKEELDNNVPVIYYRGTLTLPFAVSIPPNDSIGQTLPQIRPPQVNWGGLALLALSVWAIGSTISSKR